MYNSQSGNNIFAELLKNYFSVLHLCSKNMIYRQRLILANNSIKYGQYDYCKMDYSEKNKITITGLQK